jgi:hypothetical protein
MSNHDSSVSVDLAALKAELQAARQRLEQLEQEPPPLRTVAAVEAFEREVAEAADRVAALTVALKLQESLDSPEVQAESAELAKACGRKLRNQGRREVEVRFARGGVVRLKVSYWSGKRGGRKRGSGFYPGLVLLGSGSLTRPFRLKAVLRTLSSAARYYERYLPPRRTSAGAWRFGRAIAPRPMLPIADCGHCWRPIADGGNRCQPAAIPLQGFCKVVSDNLPES